MRPSKAQRYLIKGLTVAATAQEAADETWDKASKFAAVLIERARKEARHKVKTGMKEVQHDRT